MANTLAALIRCSSRNIPRNITNSISNIIAQPQIVRYLYAKSALGIDGFLLQRERTKAQLANIADRFKTKMTEFASDDGKSMIFTEDLKNMIYIAETPEDVDLVIKMMRKFNGQNKELRFGTFCFGPVVMRMFHHLNKPDEALSCFKAEELNGFFDQYMSYQVLLDLLYNNGKYDEVLEVVDIIKSKQLEGSKYPKNVVTFAFAACYKQNTKQSLKHALDLWKDLINVGHVATRRAITFCAGLALNQGEPEMALEIVSSAKNQFYTTIRNIRASALADMGRGDDVLLVLKSVISRDNPEAKQATFNVDVMEKVKSFMENYDNVEIKTEFDRIYNILKNEGFVCNSTLDEMLCSEIAGIPLMPFKQRERLDESRRPMDARRTRSRPMYTQRPGLSELQ